MTTEERTRWYRSLHTLALAATLLLIAGAVRLCLGHPHVVVSCLLIAIILLCAGAVAYFLDGG